MAPDDPLLHRALSAVAADRIARRIGELSRIGRTESGGVTRLALSPEEQSARELVASWLRPLGYACSLDEVANLIGLSEADSGILVGSHLDSVPEGGAYDGTLGVVAAVELAEALRAAGAARLPRIVAWMGEEGPRFGRTLLGSAAAVGFVAQADWERSSPEGTTVRALAQRCRAAWSGGLEGSATSGTQAYLELHMEQGPRMESQNVSVAVVSAIAGATHGRVVVSGEANHAGTTPMVHRRDALAAAAEMLLAAERLASEADNGLVATSGHVAVEPGAQNVIPGTAVFRMDVRASSDEQRRTFMSAFGTACHQIAERRGVNVSVEFDSEVASVELTPIIREVLAVSISELGQDPLELHSGAVHDAQNLALAGYPTGMVFVRSRGGSHNPREFVNPRDAAIGVQALVLAHAKLMEQSVGS